MFRVSSSKRTVCLPKNQFSREDAEAVMNILWMRYPTEQFTCSG